MSGVSHFEGMHELDSPLPPGWVLEGTVQLSDLPFHGHLDSNRVPVLAVGASSGLHLSGWVDS